MRKQWVLIGLIGVLLCCVAHAERKVLLLGDRVMKSYQTDVLERVGDQAECTFVQMPETSHPDWDAFCNEKIYGKGYDVIHFSYGRELMLHTDGKPAADNSAVWGMYDGLINALEKSNAFLIGCTTTPVRGKMAGFVDKIDWDYAARFNQQLGPHGIKINDLGDYTRTRLDEMVQLNSYLPTALGAQLMAEQVGNSIFEAFNEGVGFDRPRILLVGDSVVGGYYSATRNQFAGTAVVYSGGTTYNEACPDWKKIVDEYIAKGGQRGWDVIQFNWGLHAVKYVDESNKTLSADQPGARIQFTPADYANNMERFVAELKRTGARLVFATTTPIPENATGAIVHLDLAPYNDAAVAIMKLNDIPVNDLHAVGLSRMKELQIPGNVHFTAYGYKELAKQNYRMILPLLDTDTVE